MKKFISGALVLAILSTTLPVCFAITANELVTELAAQVKSGQITAEAMGKAIIQRYDSIDDPDNLVNALNGKELEHTAIVTVSKLILQHQSSLLNNAVNKLVGNTAKVNELQEQADELMENASAFKKASENPGKKTVIGLIIGGIVVAATAVAGLIGGIVAAIKKHKNKKKNANVVKQEPTVKAAQSAN